MRAPWPDRLLAKIDMRPDGCWIWTASVRRDGYGQIWTSIDSAGHRNLLSAHRAVWELLRGPVPVGLDLDHLCRNRLCVNPEHLEPVTRRENVLRGESDVADQARQSHCRRGHPLVPCERRDGNRRCCSCYGHDRHELLAISSGVQTA